MNETMRRATIGLAQVMMLMGLLWGLASCGGDDEVADFCGEVALSETDRGSFPAAPYGTGECATLQNLALTGGDGEPVSMQDIREDSQVELILLVTSAGWCSACIEEQPVLQQFHEQYGAKGLHVSIALFEDKDFASIDADFVQDWKREYDFLTLQVLADTDKQMHQYYDASLAPMLMLVDAASMKILKIFVGSELGSVRALIESKLGEA